MLPYFDEREWRRAARPLGKQHLNQETYMRTSLRLGMKSTVTYVGLVTAIAMIPLAVPAAAQKVAAAQTAVRTRPAHIPPRTAYGDPDIQGIWSNASII